MTTYPAPTKRRKMTQPRAAKIFLMRDGICFCCRNPIRQGEKWIIEHPDPLCLGGSDNDEDLWPAHEKCRRVKDKADAKAKAKRDRQVTAGWAGKPKKRGWQSRYRKKMDGTVVLRETSEATDG